MKRILALAIVLAVTAAGPASASGAYTQVLDTATAHGAHKTVEVRATYTLRETASTETAFVVIVASTRPQTLDALSAVRCMDSTGTYTFEGRFSLVAGQSAILPTSPTTTHQTFPRYCVASVQITSRKRGGIQADLGIWTEDL